MVNENTPLTPEQMAARIAELEGRLGAEITFRADVITNLEMSFQLLLGHKIFIADSYCKIQHSMGIVAIFWRAL
jgi:hypothetical protein